MNRSSLFRRGFLPKVISENVCSLQITEFPLGFPIDSCALSLSENCLVNYLILAALTGLWISAVLFKARE